MAWPLLAGYVEAALGTPAQVPKWTADLMREGRAMESDMKRRRVTCGGAAGATRQVVARWWADHWLPALDTTDATGTRPLFKWACMQRVLIVGGGPWADVQVGWGAALEWVLLTLRDGRRVALRLWRSAAPHVVVAPATRDVLNLPVGTDVVEVRRNNDAGPPRGLDDMNDYRLEQWAIDQLVPAVQLDLFSAAHNARCAMFATFRHPANGGAFNRSLISLMARRGWVGLANVPFAPSVQMGWVEFVLGVAGLTVWIMLRIEPQGGDRRRAWDVLVASPDCTATVKFPKGTRLFRSPRDGYRLPPMPSLHEVGLALVDRRPARERRVRVPTVPGWAMPGGEAQW